MRAAPKFEKRVHHVVPKFWQKHFSDSSKPGPYYRNTLDGRNLGPVGPGDKMSGEYVYLIFDEYFRPSDELEDRISRQEEKCSNGLRRLISGNKLDSEAQIDIAYLLALQACRYPETLCHFMDLGRFLAIVLGDCSQFQSARELNKTISKSGILNGAFFSDEDFARLRSAEPNNITMQVNSLLEVQGYEDFYNPLFILKGAVKVAEQILCFKWTLLERTNEDFILSDRPVPTSLKYDFEVALTPDFALKLSKPCGVRSEADIFPRKITDQEVRRINREAKSRAVEWICSRSNFVHTL